jgi:hypothetical protein
MKKENRDNFHKNGGFHSLFNAVEGNNVMAHVLEKKETM